MKTFIFKVVYECDPAHYQMEDDDSGLRSSKVKVQAETQEDAEEDITEDCIDPIHSIELLSIS